MKKYYSLNEYVHDTFGMKLYKIALDGGFTCPNRDGKVGVGGCIFCDSEGSGHFAGDRSETIKNQLVTGKSLVAGKLPKNGEKVGYIAYFQAFTGTYATMSQLKRLYYEALEDPEVKVLSIATRPDCLPDDVLKLLGEISKIKPVWVELGLQTIHEDTAKLINRGYELAVYDEAVKKLHAVGVSHVITHVIIGLPGETVDDMLATVRHVVDVGSDGIKLQLLHVLKGTVLADMYAKGEFETLSLEGYVDILLKCVAEIPRSVVIHRLTGDGDKNKLIAPLWSGDKKRTINAISKALG